ncbi:MAG: hypothetical protein M3R48_03255, partial [Candidatus Dormibacteraeota bacterium]|nr:hypothetical protein [Candidatus Dormibacteraeota bacterium]
MARIASFRRHLVPSILVAVLLGLGASFVAVGATVTDQSGASTAKDTQDPAGNYTFTLPIGWKDDGGGRFTDPAHGTELVITVKKDNGRSLDDEMKDDKTSDKGKGGYRGGQVGDQDLTLG